MKTRNYCLITGASSGLGLAFAHEMASRQINLALVALPGEDLETTSQNLRDFYQVEVIFLELDLCQLDAHIQVSNWLFHERIEIHTLINNAGMGGSSPFEQMGAEQIDRMIQLNVRATSLLTRQLLPMLKQQASGYILNVSSLASFSPIPYKAIYSASKGFIHAFSQALTYELASTNISVSVLHPGPIMTNQAVRDRIACHGRFSQMSVVSVEEVARQAVVGLYAGKKRVIPGLLNRFNAFCMRNMPESIMRKVLGNIFSREKKLHTTSLAKAAAMLVILFSTMLGLSAQQASYDIYWKNQEIGQLNTVQEVEKDSTYLHITTELTIPWVNKKLKFGLHNTHVGEQMYAAQSTYHLDNRKREDSRIHWLGNGYQREKCEQTALPVEQRNITFTVGKLYVKEPVGESQIYSERHQCFLQLKAVAPHVYELSLPGNASNRYYYQDGKLVRIEATEGLFTIRFERRENHLTRL